MDEVTEPAEAAEPVAVETREVESTEAANAAVEVAPVTEASAPAEAEAATEVTAETPAEVPVADAEVTDDLVSKITADPARAAAELRKARQQLAASRVLDNALAGANEQFRSGWLELGSMVASDDPEERAEALRILSDPSIFGDSDDVLSPDSDELAEDVSIEDRIAAEFTKREESLKAAADAAQEKLEHGTADAALFLKVKEMGYDPEAAAGSIEHFNHNALWAAVKAQPEGEKDLAKAHEQVEAAKQEMFDAKLAEIKSANTGVPVRSGTGSASVASSREDAAAKESAYEKTKRITREYQGKE